MSTSLSVHYTAAEVLDHFRLEEGRHRDLPDEQDPEGAADEEEEIGGEHEACKT